MSAGASHSDDAILGSLKTSAEFNFQEPLDTAIGRRSEVVARRPRRAAARAAAQPQVDPEIQIIEAAATSVLSSLRDSIKENQVLPITFKGWTPALNKAGSRDVQLSLKQLRRRVAARVGELCVTTTRQLEQQKIEIQGECSPL